MKKMYLFAIALLFCATAFARPITGVLSVCATFTTTLNATPGGGTWSSSNPAIASIGSSNGVVLGNAAGIVTISYVGTSGLQTRSFTVNPLPAAITCPTSGCNVCIGDSIMVTNTTSGGRWTTQSSAIATAGSLTGRVTGVSAGTTTLSYALTPSGCFVTTPITVNPSPLSFSMTGGGSYCAGGTGLAIGLSGSQTGVSYQLMCGTGAVGSPVTGTGAAISFGLQTGACTYTVIATNAFGCHSTMGSATITVNPTPGPVVCPVSGCAVCIGSNITLTDTLSGGTWGTSDLLVATIGSSSGVVTGVATSTVTVTYTLPGGCYVTTTLSVNPNPSAVTGSAPICAGQTTTLSATPPAGTTGVWSSGSPTVATVVPGTGVVTGVSAGIAPITFLLGTGCYSVTNVTVNTTPGTITCASTMGGCPGCIGSTLPLFNVVTGGTWTSSNTSVGIIGSSSGVVTGASSGVTTITYVVPPAGCSATLTITVSSNPPAITGTLSVCSGLTTPLANTTPGGSWSSSNTSIATVSSSGVVTGASGGSAIITYALPSGCFTTTTITVNPTPVVTIGLPVCIGSTSACIATPSGGIWSSNNTSVAAIGTSSGIISGLSAGVTIITYVSGPCSTTTNVTVSQYPTAITGASTVCSGNAITLSSSPTGGIWSSSGSVIATVSGGGDVTGVSGGTAVITYTLPSSGCYAIAAVTVNSTPVIAGGTSGLGVCLSGTTTATSTPSGGTWTSGNTSVATIGPSSGVIAGITTGATTITCALGTCSASTTVTVSPNPTSITGTTIVCSGNITGLSSTPAGGTWSSSNLSVATISTTGVVTGVSSGTTVITYTLSTGCFATIVVTVNGTPVITPATGTSLQVCTGRNITALGIPSGGTWTSGNPSIATIGVSSGIIAGITAGMTTITYSLGLCAATAVVTVSSNPGTIMGAASVCAGSTATLLCSPPGGTWSSSNTLIATISPSGIVAGVSSGTASMTYTLSSGCFSTAPVTISPAPVISGAGSAICAGNTLSLSGAPAGGTWTSGNPSIATVSSSGITTGITAGTATITYTLGLCSAAVAVTVSANPGAISGSTSVCTGNTSTLSCSPPGGSWSSSNTLIATVSPGGIMTGVSAGTATITYTLSSGCFTISSVTVNPAPVISGSGSAICAGNALILSGSPGGGAWTSSSTAIATVGSLSGTVTGVSSGTATITYALGSCLTTAVVSVNPMPGTITVASPLCVGATTALSSLPGGGTWSSSNTSIVSAGSLSGLATGVSAGTATITYMLPVGCYTTLAISVNPIPVVSGSVMTCVGATAGLAGTPGGGTWISSSPGICTVGATSGAIMGIMPGTTAITYSTPAGCSVSVTATVTPAPGLIACPVTGCHTCEGATAAVTNPISGGLWSSSNTAIAAIDLSGTITGVAAGTAFISYTLGGCTTTKLFTVNPAPQAFSITGGGNYCSGGPGANVGLNGSQLGVNYQLYCGSMPVGAFVPGSGLPLNLGMFAGCPFYTVIGINVLGCTSSMTGSATVTMSPSPQPINCPSPGCVLCIGNTITLTDPISGGSWNSSNAGIATIDAATGVTNGIIAGITIATYTLPGGCYVTTPVTVAPNPCTNVIPDPNVIPGVEIFPNPAHDAITIRMPDGLYSLFIVTNNVGQVLIQEPVTKAETAVNIKSLPAGVYYIALKGDNGTATRRFIKQ